ncbi:hypothetical protein [Calothrix sp. NIES-3974]|uniref:hypothetical protein n=1 Tax=Calothrix sp. NIES-3974 TaxID=2005462 RepID=UPI000B5FE939|nr:hypothetical protein [Calothrix sp. NIES-3974]BAZ04753.1 hypothetical protein NIES3974_13960 [Calothrix sp. NIES-3974]
MTEDLTQKWLGEIQTLQEQLAQVQQERDRAWESAEKWRKLYNTECEQRRSDIQMAQQSIEKLKREVKELKGIQDGLLPDADTNLSMNTEIEKLNSIEAVKKKLLAVMKECDRLQHALKHEQESHAQTRQSLTTALGDAIDSLKRKM